MSIWVLSGSNADFASFDKLKVLKKFFDDSVMPDFKQHGRIGKHWAMPSDELLDCILNPQADDQTRLNQLNMLSEDDLDVLFEEFDDMQLIQATML